ncbi:MAG: SDR family oxidoreductase [Lachnospiraceae bacterium]|nr:SDR family oxidoreductase [Lachnospiraceae bacterium]
MKILVTGAQGFVGRNLVENLKNIRDGKNKTRPQIDITEIYEFDIDTQEALLEEYCKDCQFVFHLAGVNRPKESEEKARTDAYMKGNFGFSSTLLETLKKHHNTCPVMLSSSVQASLAGRFAGSEYGKSKLAGEELFFQYARETGSKVLVYRFPNLFGKWCRPNYNSAVATFCNAVANHLPYRVNDRATELELLYIDDLICELLDALEGREHRCEYPKDEKQDDMTPVDSLAGRYCYAPVTHRATLGEIVDLLESFHAMPDTLAIPEIPEGSFAKKLYSTYLSYLSSGSMIYDLNMNRDSRGSFTELIKTDSCGQISVNIARPGIVKGQHWHNSKWEIFMVVSGHGLIQERKIGEDEKGQPYPIHSFEVTGERMKAVQMLPGYTHSITNLSETEDLVTVMWANEAFDENNPDTFFEKVE